MPDDAENKAFNQVYDQIYSMLCYSPDGQELDTTNTMVQLGINRPIDPTAYDGMFSPEYPNGNVQAACLFAALVDQLPKVGTTAGSVGANLSTVYSTIVQGANANTEATDEQKKRYANAKNQLFSENVEVKNPDHDKDDPTSPNTITLVKFTPLYQGYLSAKAKYDAAQVKYLSEFGKIDSTSISGQAELRKLQNKVDATYKDLQVAGKVEVESALSAMATSINDGLSAVISEAQELVKKSFLKDNSGAQWGVSYPIPGTKNWGNVNAADKAAYETDAYLQLMKPQKEALEQELAQKKLELKQATKEKDIEKLEGKIEALQEKLEKLQETISKKLEDIAEKYAEKMEAEVSIYSNFELSKSTYKEKKHSSSSSYGAGVAVSYGLFHAGTKTELTTSHSNADLETSDVVVRGQIATVQIVRPWFNPTLFAIKGWTTTIAGKHGISSGKMDDKAALLPLYTTSLILAKNLSIESKFEKTKIDEKSFSVSVDAQVGFGPFRFGPKYSRSSSDFSCEKTSAGFKLTNKGVQIIGYLNAIVPPCPSDDAPQKKS